MTMHVKVGGVWKTIAAPSIKVGGAWKAIQGGWVKVAGVWKQFYVALGATLPASFSTSRVWPNNAYILISTDGTYSDHNSSGTWRTAGTSAEFEIRASGLTGDTPSGTFNVWMSATTSPSWAMGTTQYGGEKVANFTVEIRMAAAPNTVLTTSSFQITATSLA